MRRINLLRAHGSPTGYLYRCSKCRCVACRGQKAAYFAAHRIAHREQRRDYNAAYNITHREQRAAYLATHREEIAATRRVARLKRRYGLLPGEWEAMLAAQGNRCAICGTAEPGGRTGQWHTDHDHDTGLTRGLLCHNCNAGLGHFRDNPAILVAAIQYLQASSWMVARQSSQEGAT